MYEIRTQTCTHIEEHFKIISGLHFTLRFTFYLKATALLLCFYTFFVLKYYKPLLQMHA